MIKKKEYVEKDETCQCNLMEIFNFFKKYIENVFYILVFFVYAQKN